MRSCRKITIVLSASCIAFVSSIAQQTDSSAVADSLLLTQIQRSMQPVGPVVQQAPSAPRSSLSTNPDLSAIGDFRSAYVTMGKRKIDMYLNQLEIQVSSVVDPYARADIMFSYGKDLETGELAPGLEIATLTSLSLPYQMQVTLGKFKPAFGKINILHPHAYSFIDFPKVTEKFFSSEGMFMEGASLSWLVPNPYDFFQELTLETGRVETNAILARGEDSQLSYFGHLKNFFDLTLNSTLEIGFSGASGPNQFGLTSTFGGIDVTYKWKPVQFNVLQSFSWQTELLLANMQLDETTRARTHGLYSMAEYQFAQRWFVGARYDYTQSPDDEGKRDVAGTLLFRFQPTEFQIVALEYQYTDRNYERSTHGVTLRVIFGIGSHAAHQY
ncbi:MAG: hypothetical protein NTU47_18040 [Ignavibacteriales bacterium]|nr:hypothetical protein [Ignavibacteriales bacterium]